jgi:hypothetical protein
MTTIEKADSFVWARISRRWGRMVHVTHQAGNVHFAEGVHRAVMDFVLDCVAYLGLADQPIVVRRGSAKLKKGHRVLGMADQPDSGYLSGICYSRSLTLRSTMKLPSHQSGEVREVKSIEFVILHELLHLAHPEADEGWVSAMTLFIFLMGWNTFAEVLEATPVEERKLGPLDALGGQSEQLFGA